MIRWDDGATDVLLNPRLAEGDRADVHRRIAACGPLDGHVWVTTSGSTGRLKPVALAKAALLAAAEAVNKHLDAAADDVWCRPLPLFHVGGLGIHARAHLSGSAVRVLEPWDPVAFHMLLADQSVTLTSLVPTQVQDLVAEGLTAPPSVRAVLVGGGALPASLHDRARELGWPVRPSYGATETCAAVAIGSAPDALVVLGHMAVRTTDDGRLAFRGPALLTGYAGGDGLVDPKTDGWWVSSDRGRVSDGRLRVLGRVDDVIKIGGESVSLSALQTALDALLPAPGVTDAAVIDAPDQRLGAVVVLVASGDREAAETLRERFNAAVLPFERAREVVLVPQVARTALGKRDSGAIRSSLSS